MNKLTRTRYLNPYFINSKDVKVIVFYDDHGIILHTNGWLSSENSSNHAECKELESLEFRCARKLNLDKKDHFFMTQNVDAFVGYREGAGTVVYIYTPKIDFQLLGKQRRERTFSIETYQRYRVGNVITSKWEGSVETEYGILCETLATKINETAAMVGGTGLTSLDASKLINEYPKIVSALGL